MSNSTDGCILRICFCISVGLRIFFFFFLFYFLEVPLLDRIALRIELILIAVFSFVVFSIRMLYIFHYNTLMCLKSSAEGAL